MSSRLIGRCVVIELTHLTDSQLSLIGKTLSNLISLSNHLIGNRRITYFMVELIGFTSRQIIPLLDVKSKPFLSEYFNKLNNLIELKRETIDCNNEISKSICVTNIAKNIQLIIRKLWNNVSKEDVLECIELTYISGRQTDRVIQDICRALNNINFNDNNNEPNISMVNILCIIKNCSFESRPKLDEKPIICGPSSSATFDYKIAEEFEGLIETKTIIENKLAIEGFFKVWFHDSNFETEKIKIINNNNNAFVIRCDLKEAILDVNAMPVMKTSKLNWIPTETIGPSILTNNNKNDCCYELKIVGLVKREGLCDSIVFGIPYVLSPTRCHRLSFTELSLNANRFHAFVEVMNERQLVLVLEHKQQLSPNNYFAILSSPDKKTLIMKSVAAQELLLPYFNDSVDKLMANSPPPEIVDSVRQQLSQFPLSEVFNPLYVNNNLYDYISPDGSYPNPNLNPNLNNY